MMWQSGIFNLREYRIIGYTLTTLLKLRIFDDDDTFPRSEFRRLGSARVRTAVQRRRHQSVRDLAAVQQTAGHQSADQETQHEHPTRHRVVRRMAVAVRRSVSTQVQRRTEHGQPRAGE